MKQLFRQRGYLFLLITFTTLFFVSLATLGASLNVFFCFFALTTGVGGFSICLAKGRQNLSLIWIINFCYTILLKRLTKSASVSRQSSVRPCSVIKIYWTLSTISFMSSSFLFYDWFSFNYYTVACSMKL